MVRMLVCQAKGREFNPHFSRIRYYLMGQKTNPVGFRVGNRRMWNFVWATDSVNYSTTLLTNLEMSQKITQILDRFGLLANNLVIKKSAKQPKILGRVVNMSKLVPV